MEDKKNWIDEKICKNDELINEEVKATKLWTRNKKPKLLN